jgi:tetratricopeptide (TPR) repeat protein
VFAFPLFGAGQGWSRLVKAHLPGRPRCFSCVAAGSDSTFGRFYEGIVLRPSGSGRSSEHPLKSREFFGQGRAAKRLADAMNRPRALALAGLLLAAGGWLFHACAVNQNVNFLAPGPGSWIVYPTPPQAPPLAGIRMTTVFRREFVLPRSPAAATLSWRCLKAGQLSLNGVTVAASDSLNWKRMARLDAANWLRPGANQIEARVTCEDGLPALSLELAADGFLLKSDETWQSSLAGAEGRPARMASQPLEPAPGNWLYKTEDIQGALRECWPVLTLFVMVSALAVGALGRWDRGWPGPVRAGGLVLAAVWAMLFAHNLPLLPAMSGFDASGHLAYIEFIQRHKALPSADQGWEFFQAPLYYVLGAGVLGAFGLRTGQLKAEQILGFMNLLLVAVELALILASLRLLFPGRRRLQLAGLLLAAFLPLQVYLVHYPTNETLGAAATTGAIFLCLRILRQENPPLAWYAGLGLMMGAALLSKASAVLALAAIFLALAAKGWLGKQSPSAFLRQAGLAFGLCLLVGGWHYWRLWRQFGSPLTGNWDPAVGKAWWQLPGYRTPSYYLSFGQSLVRPFFSGFHSFWDGLYSTWWGDGFIGGATRLYTRPPWNYNLMTAGFVLALIPSGLALTGLWRALGEGMRRRRLDWLFLATVPLLYGLAIFSMSLKLPYYSQSRALYGLPVVLPFCALGALGLDFWMARLKRTRSFLLVWLGVWLLNVYASFWIRPDTVQARLSVAAGLFEVPGQDPGPAFAKVLELDPRNAEAVVALADLERKAGQISNAVARLEAAARTSTNAMIDTALAQQLGAQGRMAEALEWAGRACELHTDYAAAPALLCALLLRAGQNEQAAWAGSLALALKPQDGEVHFNAGLALVRLKRFAEAASQFSGAVEVSPRDADAHFWLGIALWNLPGSKAEGRDQVAIAVGLSPQNTRWKSTLEEMERGLQ